MSAFDAIEEIGNTSNLIIASGLKIALITTLFGLVAMVMGRLFAVLLTLKSEE
ncbi:MotA/TolQ/ExbB proton channel family protein [Patiriisocius marinistellae]|uniref:MotA/TolQ/ExbB proton channel family protein n=1 Tax=Patiriisocius marinistellae TaxID=2494560 RepID=UPI00125DC156